VLDSATPYCTIDLRRRVELQPDEGYACADQVGAKYGADLRRMDQPGAQRVVVTLRPAKVNARRQELAA
jgi:hypothetical protein